MTRNTMSNSQPYFPRGLSEGELAKLSPEARMKYLADLSVAQQREVKGLEDNLHNYNWDTQSRRPIFPNSSQDSRR